MSMVRTVDSRVLSQAGGVSCIATSKNFAPVTISLDRIAAFHYTYSVQ
jgi:hypothetical protein